MQSRELAGGHGDSRSHKVGFNQRGMVLHRGIQSTEDDTLTLHRVIDSLPECCAILMHHQTPHRRFRQRRMWSEAFCQCRQA